VGAGGRRSLMASFRLHAGTAALVNHLFPPLMKDLYEPVEGQHEQKNAAVAEVLHVLSPDEKGFRSEEGHQEEARRLASRLKEIVDGRSVTVWDEAAKTWRPARYGDVAILMRRMSHLHVYEQALEAQGVPYYVVAGRGFYQQQEVQDVLALLRVLDDPSDDLSLVAVLRSPFFSVSDEGLYHLRQLGARLHDHLSAGAAAGHLDAEDRRGLRRAAKRLPEWAAQKDRRGLAALVDLVAFESGYAAGAVGKFGGERAYANLRQMVELARGFQDRGLSALGDYIAYVTDFMKNEMRAEQAPVESPGADSVRLMTIHKAKGLEFPIVVVPDLAYAPAGRHASCLLSNATGVALRLRDEDGEGRSSAALALAVAEGAEAEQAEGHRLFYVALTRAKDYLMLSSHQAYNMVDGRQTWLRTSLESLQAQIKPGTCEAVLPTGHIVRFCFQTPDGQPAGRSARRGGPRSLFTAGRVAWELLHERGQHGAGAATDALARVHPTAAPYPAPVRLAATSVAEYARCPASYWWSHEFGVDEPEPQGPSPGGLTPQAWGVAGHRVMELATSPAAEVTAAAVAGALREVEAAAADLPQLETRLRSAVDAFWASPLGRRVAGARRAYRELPFIVTVGAAEVRGTIDLVFQGEDGRWELVDYKSSGPSAEKAAAAAKPYELQLGLYALAAGRWRRTPVDRGSIWFLGSATTAEVSVTAADLERIEQAAQAALEGIAARRFDKPDVAACSSCRLRRLCETISR
jgi:ATP-dependent helicase/nuclease subunit A